MKLFNLLTLVMLCFVFVISSCTDNSNRTRQAVPVAPAPYANPSYNTPSGNVPTMPTTSSSEAHYKCPNNCDGGIGDAAGNCPVCGTALAHNQAYHNNTTTPSVSPPVPSDSPAQNTSGVFHYTCSNGCAGGAASAGNCATCGAALAHNQAYHN